MPPQEILVSFLARGVKLAQTHGHDQGVSYSSVYYALLRIDIRFPIRINFLCLRIIKHVYNNANIDCYLLTLSLLSIGIIPRLS